MINLYSYLVSFCQWSGSDSYSSRDLTSAQDFTWEGEVTGPDHFPRACICYFFRGWARLLCVPPTPARIESSGISLDTHHCHHPPIHPQGRLPPQQVGHPIRARARFWGCRTVPSLPGWCLGFFLPEKLAPRFGIYQDGPMG